MTSLDNVPIALATPREAAGRDRAVFAAADVVPVKFITDGRVPRGAEFHGYNAGEVAGFSRIVGQQLVDEGVASFDLDAALKVAAPPAVLEYANGALTPQAAGDIGVEFLRGWDTYSAGDRAGFSDSLARRLIASGVARRAGPVTLVGRALAAIRAALTGS